MTNLSVIIITKNEVQNIAKCLASVSFADEIIVFDSGSTDGTPDICKKHGAIVTVSPDWPGDGIQKNRALAKAKGEWVLCLDADERVSPQLAIEIQAILSKTHYVAYCVPYQSSYCGKVIRFGDWQGEAHVRLFKRQFSQFSDDIVHCRLQTQGAIGRLKNPIVHHPFNNLGIMLGKMNDYSSQSAKIYFERGKKASMWTAFSHSVWAFIRGYILKLGFLDGQAGFLLAVSNAEGTYYRYLKLMYLSEK